MNTSDLTARSDAFRIATQDLARDLSDLCRPLVPPAQARVLRRDQLGVVAGIEAERPLVAAVAALAPAICAAGDAVCIAALQGGSRTLDTLSVAEPVVELGIGALELLRTPTPDAGLRFAHGMALTTHAAAGSVPALSARMGFLWWGRRPFAPSLWPPLSETLRRQVEAARVLARGGATPGEADWDERLRAAAGCRDAAIHAMRSYSVQGWRGGGRPLARLHRCLAFASLYCGFAVLRDPPGAAIPPATAA